MGTTPENTSKNLMTSSSMTGHANDTGAYPALAEKPSGEAVVKRTDDNRDLYPDPYTPQPPRGPAYGGAPYGPTTSTTREQRARQMQRAMDVEDSLIADGQDPARPDLTRGPHSGPGDHDGRTASQMREDLLRADGASEDDIAWDRLNRGR